ncbi:MAG TPA: L-fuconate dehydratase [Candidatus Eisenbacteria bacterium]|nr:L-fuconate dehydratase [Candidatus Eisenbacteria bacterium]
MTSITAVDVLDIRFPTSRSLDGSDAMNPDPDYSAAYVVIRTDAADGLEGHGLTFTIGRGTEVVVAGVNALRPLVLGRDTDELFADMGEFWRQLVGDSQLRWIGPEKGVIHLATAAVVNAVWDLFAKTRRVPLWKLLTDMTPEELVALVDFRYIDDALSPERALARLRELAPTRAEREATLRRDGYPAYTTSVGWLGYDDAKIRRLCQEALAEGWTRFKLKVGADVQDDRRRARVVREEIGPAPVLAVDANQRWGVNESIEWMGQLAEFDPYWIEEPTSPDDILGHATIARALAPIRVATGEHVHNRVMFKQLFQAEAIAVCQIDACRLGGVNEVLAVLLMAAEFGVPVCPHAGGVGLCELVQHLAIVDYVCVSGSLEGRMVEYVDHLHEHFLDPVEIRNAAYVVPTLPGYSAEMRPDSLARYRFPDGSEWRAIADEVAAAAAAAGVAGAAR